MNKNNRFILEKELVLSLVLLGILVSLVVTFSLGSSRIVEGWRLIFNHAHEMEVSIDEIRNILVITTLHILVILAPIFVLIFLGCMASFFFKSRKADVNYLAVSKSVMPALTTSIILIATFTYIYFKFDHILSFMSLTVEQIFTLILEGSLEVFASILVFKILSISLIISFLRLRIRPNVNKYP